jgi:hypothetical protein
MSGRRTAVLVLVAAPGWAASGPGPGADDGTSAVASILADWNARRRVANVVGFHTSGEVRYPRGGLTAPKDPDAHPKIKANFPESDQAFTAKLDLIVDNARRRFRKDETGGLLNFGNATLTARTETLAYDGSHSYYLFPKGQPAAFRTNYTAGDQVVKQDGLVKVFFTIESCPLLFALGYVGPTNPLTNFDTAGPLADPAPWRGGGRGTIADHECVILRSFQSPDRFEEFWVDPACRSAVRKWKLVQKDRLLAEHEIDYQQVNGHWLPAGWRFEHRETSGPAPVRMAVRMTVNRIDLDPPVADDVFTLKLAPDTLVLLPAPGAEMVVDAEGNLRPYIPPRLTRRSWMWLSAAVLLGLAGVSVWIARRRRHRAGPPGEA